MRFAHGVEGAKHQRQVFFGGKAPDIQHHGLAVVHAPARPQRWVATAGVKQLGVDAAADDLEVLVARSDQFAADALGWHQGDGGLVMEFAQIRHNGAAQQAKAVVAAVAVEIGVEIARHRQPKLVGRGKRRPAERPFGGDLHHVGTLPGP